MKQRFSKLLPAEQERVELAYHRMNPADFDEVMSRATRHTPDIIQFPPQLIKSLKAVATAEGEPEYQAMVQRWVEERLRQELKLAS